jgi:sulfur carrier protein
MIIIVNDLPFDFSGKTLHELLDDLEKHNRFKQVAQGIAIAINQEVVPKSLWSTTELKEQSQVFIFESIAGG